MMEHLRGLSIGHWVTIAFRLSLTAFSLRVLWLLALNMSLTLTIFGPALTIVVLSVLGITLWFSVERIGDILNPTVRVPPR